MKTIHYPNKIRSGSARPDVRGTAEPYGGAYPHPVRPFVRPLHTHHLIADRRAETDGLT